MGDGDVAEDLRLPQTVIGRLVKEALPAGVIISKVSPFHIPLHNVKHIPKTPPFAQHSLGDVEAVVWPEC